jgi:hypothetical protein
VTDTLRPPSEAAPADGPRARTAADPQAAGPRPETVTHGCTLAQLRRFIKSRPYVPLHELRRRFELGGEPDDVSVVETAEGPAYIGLPDREAAMLAELLRSGEVGLEFSRDPDVRAVLGVYPMRPIPRP